MKHIIIAGSGPVGSFMAVLCSQLGCRVTVYEKREEFTRNINLKIDSDLFKEVQEVLSRFKIRSFYFTKFFHFLQRQNDRILIKEFERRFTEEAMSLGAMYITREVTSFQELYKEHAFSDPVILDCTGRNSNLRASVFGSDETNVATTPLQHAMYINFKAKMSGATSLYQVMKNVPNIKLTEVVMSKKVDDDGYTEVTIPVFITSELARHFDAEHPDINKNPINPFNISIPVSDSIFFPISSIVGNLLVDDCNVDLDSVKVKKIVISCGYAKRRSRDNFICLGDSAAHMAFFRSLNLGLKHALELFIHLSMFTKDSEEVVNYNYIMNQFNAKNPHLNPIKVYPTGARNVFFVITKILWYGCFVFCTTNQRTKRLTDVTGRTEKEIYTLLATYNCKLSRWDEALKEFEGNRDEDIQSEINNNKLKNVSYEFASLFIDINGISVFKVSEMIRSVKGRESLYREDFDFLLRCFKARRQVLIYSADSQMKNEIVVSIVYHLLNQLESNTSPTLDEVKRLCGDKKLPSEEKVNFITLIINNQFVETKQRLEVEILKNTIGLWPKLFGLRLDNSDVCLSIVLTLIKNELRGIVRLSSDSNLLKTNHESQAGASH